MSLSDADLRDLAIVARSTVGTIVSGIVERRRAAAYDRLLNATGEELVRLQGRLRAFDELLKDIREAPQRLTQPSSGSSAARSRPDQSMRNPV